MLKIGLSACFFAPDPQRNIFRGKRLLYAEESMLHWIMRHGALPLMLPSWPGGPSEPDRPRGKTPKLTQILAEIDGLVLQGGSDVSPTSYGEQALQPQWSGDRVRDLYEMELVRGCMKRGIPVLGICRGLQLINVALGGTLYQDIATQTPAARVHRDAEKYDQIFHEVSFEPGSRLSAMYRGKPRGLINTVHHQAIKDLGKDLAVEARSTEDGIIEAIRYVPKGSKKQGKAPYVFALQWHPEFVDPARKDLLDTTPVFEDFAKAIQKRKRRA